MENTNPTWGFNGSLAVDADSNYRIYNQQFASFTGGFGVFESAEPYSSNIFLNEVIQIQGPQSIAPTLLAEWFVANELSHRYRRASKQSSKRESSDDVSSYYK
jgi:hypothetical protein